ncbi:MAG: YafY family protein [Spirochaetaceae bacterium]|jgi:predicted DNA-binding transcriptional regulator YafY|nr:YafY family protein [Spirochaetaceae bacterium]
MKIDRLLSILLLLIKKQRVTAPELANYFETSVRTIYRDMDTLSLAGIPLISEQGTGGGYSIMPGFILDKQVFKVDELLALMAGLKGMEAVIGGETYRKTVEKVSNLAPEAGDPTLEIDFFGWDEGNRIRQNVQLLHGAIASHQAVQFHYTNLKNENLQRRVDPYKLFFRGNHWYIMGYCNTRQDYRFFRISRMENLEQLAQTFILREDSKGQWDKIKSMPHHSPVQEIKLHILSGAAAKAREYFSKENISLREDGSLMVQVSYPVDEWVYSYLMSYGEQIIILQPQTLREELLRRAQNFINQNKNIQS